ncbi:MAG: TonB-dependent receptor, partial [Bacteroidota bacterium]
VGNSSYIKSIVSLTESDNSYTADRIIDKDTPEEEIIISTEAEDTERRFAVSSVFNTKLSRKATLRTGVLYEGFNVKSLLRDRNEQDDEDGDGLPDLVTFRNSDDNFNLFQPFIQGQFRLTKKLTLNAGLHAQYSDLNEQFVLEPRASVNYNLADNQSLEFGYGVHHQNVPLPILFLNENIDGTIVQTNKNLDFIRSQHFVLGYDLRFAKDWRAKLEVYYQDITDAAVERFSSSYSTLTEGADFAFSNDKVSLVNEGKGFNQGLELTVEKFFSQGYYGLFTASIFESRYEGSDGIERNTPFNNGYVFNALAGREIPVGSDKRNALFFDTRLSFAGGRYFTPVDLEASQEAGFEITIDEEAFSEQLDSYFRWDIKFGFKLNSKNKKQSHQIYVDLQNVTNRENVFVQRYNRLTNQVDQINQIGFFPDVGYRFQF